MSPQASAGKLWKRSLRERRSLTFSAPRQSGSGGGTLRRRGRARRGHGRSPHARGILLFDLFPAVGQAGPAHSADGLLMLGPSLSLLGVGGGRNELQFSSLISGRVSRSADDLQRYPSRAPRASPLSLVTARRVPVLLALWPQAAGRR